MVPYVVLLASLGLVAGGSGCAGSSARESTEQWTRPKVDATNAYNLWTYNASRAEREGISWSAGVNVRTPPLRLWVQDGFRRTTGVLDLLGGPKAEHLPSLARHLQQLPADQLDPRLRDVRVGLVELGDQISTLSQAGYSTCPAGSAHVLLEVEFSNAGSTAVAPDAKSLTLKRPDGTPVPYLIGLALYFGGEAQRILGTGVLRVGFISPGGADRWPWPSPVLPGEEQRVCLLLTAPERLESLSLRFVDSEAITIELGATARLLAPPTSEDFKRFVTKAAESELQEFAESVRSSRLNAANETVRRVLSAG